MMTKRGTPFQEFARKGDVDTVMAMYKQGHKPDELDDPKGSYSWNAWHYTIYGKQTEVLSALLSTGEPVQPHLVDFAMLHSYECVLLLIKHGLPTPKFWQFNPLLPYGLRDLDREREAIRRYDECKAIEAAFSLK